MEGTSVSRARALHSQARWPDACELFLIADHEAPLAVEDLDLLGEAAQMCGRHDDAVMALERGFTIRAAAGELDRAAAAAFWLFTEFLYGGEMARASGWVARVRNLTDELYAGEPGWLRVLDAYRGLAEERYVEARMLLTEAVTQGKEGHDVDLVTYGTMLTGRSLLKEGQIVAGLDALDEAMLRVTSGQTSPRATSNLYCSGIGTCEEEALDLARAGEWALSLERWMAELPPSPPGVFLDNCRVYRAVLLRRRGEVRRALAELDEAARDLADGNGVRVAGHAWYELGETHRLLGDDDAAESAYRRAVALGKNVQPGLALLRLRQGDSTRAEAGIRRALAEAMRIPDRAHLLPAGVEVLLAAGATDDARIWAAELEDVAESMGSSAIRAERDLTLGVLALSDDDPAAALRLLRRASETWRALAAPYDVARTGVLIARACRALDDEEGAALELEMAANLFASLGAVNELGLARHLLGEPDEPTHGLSARELEVLTLVVQGLTNRAIAEKLFLSERTVHRHLANVFHKLGVGSRTEAATYALQHRFIG
ncbi:LuxR C-terminal-related transcriptional regulator [Agromyces bracchium]|uniref:LuxR C-terminal-related transcriptional regulator n=1 Tax=Agromyces bracchium TaxID=88376 RepID=UPI0018ACEEDC|nr:helix-turn-helix transcriptional regulator [Agromyces bracchium]